MALKNSANRFGKLTQFLHWLIFILFVIQFALMYRQEYFPKDSPEKTLFFLLHESFGVCLFFIAFAMILWSQVGTRPAFPSSMSLWEIFLAKMTHTLLYVVMLLQPISGVAMSMFGGYPISFFGWFNLPMLLPKHKALGSVFHTTHVWTSYVIIGLVVLHAFAALYHHFLRKDTVLRRMLPSN